MSERCADEEYRRMLEQERAEMAESLRRLADVLLPKLPVDGARSAEQLRDLAAKVRQASYHTASIWNVLGDCLVEHSGERYARATASQLSAGAGAGTGATTHRADVSLNLQ